MNVALLKVLFSSLCLFIAFLISSCYLARYFWISIVVQIRSFIWFSMPWVFSSTIFFIWNSIALISLADLFSMSFISVFLTSLYGKLCYGFVFHSNLLRSQHNRLLSSTTLLLNLRSVPKSTSLSWSLSSSSSLSKGDDSRACFGLSPGRACSRNSSMREFGDFSLSGWWPWRRRLD